MDWLTQTQWSPYVAGIGIGLLTGLTFLISNKALACSTTFAKSAGMIEKVFRKECVEQREFFKEHAPSIDWQWMLVTGIFIGGFFSAILSGSFEIRFVHDWWGQAISPNPISRLIGGLLGGFLLGFGARWAGGCTSGHGISGMIQLSLGSMLAVAFFFAGGIATAFFMAGWF